MGSGASRHKVTEEAKRQHREAESLLAEEKRKSLETFKLLLLGTGDSGKSTIVKQLRIIHMNGFEKEELARNRQSIAGNILHSLCAIIEAMTVFAIDFESEEVEAEGHKLLELQADWENGERRLSPETWQSMARIWKDPGVQTCFQRSNEYQLSDSTKYFCDDIARISNPEYLPSDQDMLRTRVSTTGIVELDLKLRGLTVTIIDVGGQRSQRKKWIHCFENVNALIFIAAVSEYNQVLFEDRLVNRMHETIMLFKTVINSVWFSKGQSVVLFLNKKDIFEEKIKTYPLTFAFPEYEGPKNDYECAMNYIQNKFESERENQKKTVYSHQTCATDTKNVQFVMDACFDTILTKNINKSGMY